MGPGVFVSRETSAIHPGREDTVLVCRTVRAYRGARVGSSRPYEEKTMGWDQSLLRRARDPVAFF